MSDQATLATRLRTSLKYFRGTASGFEEGDSEFAPEPGMFTVAAQVAHVAHTVDWFVEGAFGSGWDMDFPGIAARRWPRRMRGWTAHSRPRSMRWNRPPTKSFVPPSRMTA